MIRPVRFVRYTVFVLFNVFFISTLKMFLVALACTFTDISNSTMREFPERECWTGGHWVLAVSSALLLFLSGVFGLFVAFVSIENNVKSKDFLAGNAGRYELHVAAYRILLAAVGMCAFERRDYQAVMQMGLSALIVYDTINFVPYFNPWINMVRCGLFSVSLWCSMVLGVKTVWLDDSGDGDHQAVFALLVGGMVPAYIVGHCLTLLRLRRLDGTRMIKLDEEGNVEVIRSFESVFHVEVATRFVREHEDDDLMVSAALAILDAGTQQYPDSAVVHLSCANFVAAHRYKSDQLQLYLDKARRLRPGPIERYNLFLRDQERLRKQQTAAQGETTMDLVSYIEFQTKYKAALLAYKNTLRSVRKVWRLVVGREPSLEQLTDAFNDVETCEAKADRTYRSLLEHYPKSVTALRSFGKFCEEIKSDQALANKYFHQADKQEELAVEARRKKLTTGGVASEVDDRVDGTIVSNEVGTITFVNSVACSLWGWRKDDLLGRNVSVLMPSPMAEQHHEIMRRYNETGVSKLLGAPPRALEAMHKDGHIFAAKLAVSRVDSAQGVSFVAVARAVADEEAARITINSYGVIQTVTDAVLSMFGYKNSTDLVGNNVQMLMPAKVNHDAILKRRREQGSQLDNLSARRLIAKRADGSSFPIAIDLSSTGEDPETMTFIGVVRELNEGLGLITMNTKGVIQSANAHAAELLGMASGKMVGENISAFMPSPYSEMHNYWLDRFAKTQISAVVGRGRRVSMRHKGGECFDVTLEVSFKGQGVDRLMFARFSTVDERVREERRTHSSMACVVTFRDGQVVAAEGGVKRVFRFVDGVGSTTHLSGASGGRFSPRASPTAGSASGQDRADEEVLLGMSFSDLFLGTDARGVEMLKSSTRQYGGLRQQTDPGRSATVLIATGKPDLMEVRCFLCNQLEGFVAVDASGVVVEANDHAEMLFGNRIMGMPFKPLFSSGFDLDHVGRLKPDTTMRQLGTVTRPDGAQLDLVVEGVAKAGSVDGATVQMRVTYNHTADSTVWGDTTSLPKRRGVSFSIVSDEASTSPTGRSMPPISPALEVPMDVWDDALLDDKNVAAHYPHAPFPTGTGCPVAHDLTMQQPQQGAVFRPVPDDESVCSRAASEHSDNSGLGSEVSFDARSAQSSESMESSAGRGKRYKRVARVIRMHRIRKSLSSLRLRMWVSALTLVVVHSVFFGVVRDSIHNYLADIDRMLLAGNSGGIAHGCCTAAREIERALVVGDFAKAEAQRLAMAAKTERLDDNLRSLYLGDGKLASIAYPPLEHLYVDPTFAVNVWQDTTPKTNITVMMGLWDLSRQFLVSAAVVAATNVSDVTVLRQDKDWRFLVENGAPTMCPALQRAAELEKDSWVDDSSAMNLLVGALMAAEITLCFLLWLLLIHPAVSNVSGERITLFSYFLNIPQGVLLRLATKSINMEEDEDEDGETDDSENEEFRKATEEQERAADKEARRRTLKIENSKGGDGTTPRGGGAVSEDETPRLSLRHRLSKLLRRGPEQPPDPATPRPRRKQGVRKGRRRKRANKKRLAASGVTALKFGLPMMLAMALLCVALFLSLRYIQQSMEPSVDLVPMEERVYYMERVRYYALELVALEHGWESLSDARTRLRESVRTMRQVHDELRDVATFRHSDHADLLYKPQCLFSDPSLCRTSDDELYPTVALGLDIAVQRFMDNAEALADDAMSALTPDNPTFLLIDALANTDLARGVDRAIEITLDESEDLEPRDRVFQIVLFVLVLGDMFLYFVAIYNPFVKRADLETRRAAMMLSLLPDYVKLEELRPHVQ